VLAEAECGQVGPGHLDREWVPVDTGDGQPGGGEGGQVAADAAAQVEHPPLDRRGEAGAVPGGHLRAGELLQPVRGQVEPVRQVAEPWPGARPEPGLGQGGGDQVVRVAGPAQSGALGQGGRGLVRRQRP
jgi:hypothetical protein